MKCSKATLSVVKQDEVSQMWRGDMGRKALFRYSHGEEAWRTATQMRFVTTVKNT